MVSCRYSTASSKKLGVQSGGAASCATVHLYRMLGSLVGEILFQLGSLIAPAEVQQVFCLPALCKAVFTNPVISALGLRLGTAHSAVCACSCLLGSQASNEGDKSTAE